MAKSHDWHQQPEMKGALIGIRILLWIERYLGRPFFTVILWPVMSLYWLFGQTARRASKEYLTTLHRYGLAHNIRLPNTYSLAHFMSFGQALLDKLLCWSGKIQLKDVVLSDESRDILNRREGMLIMGSHLGNIEVCRALAEMETTQTIHVLMQVEQTAGFNQVLTALNPQSQINLVSISDITPETMIFLKSALDRGDYVAILADRLPAAHHHRSTNYAHVLDFLGRPAAFPTGPFVLAMLLKAPTYFMVGLKMGTQYHIHLHALTVPNVARGERTQAMVNMMQEYVDHLTHYCLSAPLQWFNFYPFWQPIEGATHETSTTPR
ncbi:hypothetical protein J7552_03385 [Wohlfahrtiimonas chitiniclastica]|uniref:LpxL/LpxP family acyltransferase n=1 Tax=Wohlfahrtiimonas chitiniclastica TaxID=400946 RepID=UPI001BCB40F9|nr:hypothetical protein [Wohlfahrtiimonas chitiniclastica]MBS7820321.1 hypothetical protein [Wohlfahrtiimonas chitiniclastica]